MIYSNLDFNHKKILITGGAGFIGSNLAFYFQENFPQACVVIFDCFRSGEKFSNGNLKSFGHYKNLIGFEGELICGNLNDSADMQNLKSKKFDYIFHQAAISDTRVNDQEIIMKTNVSSFYDILEMTLASNATLVYASSGATYGSMPSPQTLGREKPQNPYGYSKYAMDKIAKKFSNAYPELKIVGLKYFNAYGRREYFKNSTASMVVQLSHQILAGKSPRLFERSDEIFRDFIYIDDIIQANIKACQSNNNGVYNVGTGKARSFEDIVHILQQELGTDIAIEYFKNPYKDYQMHTQADISLSREDFSFDPQFSLEQGIRAYLPEIVRLFKEEVN